MAGQECAFSSKVLHAAGYAGPNTGSIFAATVGNRRMAVLGAGPSSNGFASEGEGT